MPTVLLFVLCHFCLRPFVVKNVHFFIQVYMRQPALLCFLLLQMQMFVNSQFGIISFLPPSKQLSKTVKADKTISDTIVVFILW